MSHEKPTPILADPTLKRCPVCGETSYSRAGIHPQCAVLQADRKRMMRLKQDANGQAASKPVLSFSSWQRLCPRCGTVQHIRLKVCSCGHTFAGRPRPPTSDHA